MSSQVIGSWRNFDIRLLSHQDLPELAKYLTENFHFHEPIGQSLPRDDEFVKVTNFKIEQILQPNPGLSLIAIEKSSGQIAGLQLQFIWTKQDADLQKCPTTKTLQQYDQSYLRRRVQDAIYAPLNEKRFGMFEDYNVSEIVWNFVASTSLKYRGVGLGSELYSRMVTLLKEQEHKLVFSIFTNPYSRKCAEKVGFVEIGRSYFAQAKDDKGNVFIPKMATDDDFATIMVLKL